jgi:hypothetical protein
MSEIGIPLVKSDVIITWDLVPDAFLMSSGTSIPTNIVNCLGTVNNDTFFGYLMGTLLFVGVKLTRNIWGLAAGTESHINWTVEFHFSLFDPPKGFTGSANLPIVDSTTRGWNCQPWRGNPVPPGDANAGLWFGASYDGTNGGIFSGSVGGNRLLKYSNFHNMWNSPN